MPDGFCPLSDTSSLPYKLALHTWYVGAKAHRISISRLNDRVNGIPNVFGQRPTSRFFLRLSGRPSTNRFVTTKKREVGRSGLPPCPTRWGTGFERTALALMRDKAVHR